LKGDLPGPIPAKAALIWFSGFRGTDLNVCGTPPFSIMFRFQIENQVSDYRLLGTSSFFWLIIFLNGINWLKTSHRKTRKYVKPLIAM
jgi:hypothetical protein